MSEVCSGEQTFAQLRTGFRAFTAGNPSHSDAHVCVSAMGACACARARVFVILSTERLRRVHDEGRRGKKKKKKKVKLKKHKKQKPKKEKEKKRKKKKKTEHCNKRFTIHLHAPPAACEGSRLQSSGFKCAGPAACAATLKGLLISVIRLQGGKASR